MLEKNDDNSYKKYWMQFKSHAWLLSNPEHTKKVMKSRILSSLPLRNPSIKMVIRSVQWGMSKSEKRRVIQKKEVDLKNELNSVVQKQ